MKGGPERPTLEVKQIPIDDQVVVRRLEAGDVNTRSGNSRNRDVAVAIVRDLDVALVVDEDGVGRSIAKPIHSKVDVEFGNAAARRIIDVNIIGAAERVERDLLNAGQVHRDIAKIASEQGAASGSGGKIEILGPGTAVEKHRVEALTTVQPVAPVARVPDQHIIAPAAEHLVAAGSPNESIVAVAARQEVVAAATLDRVISVSAKQLVVARTADQHVVAIVDRRCGAMVNGVEIGCCGRMLPVGSSEIEAHFQSLSLIVMISPSKNEKLPDRFHELAAESVHDMLLFKIGEIE